MMSPRWQHKLFLTSLSLTRRTTNNYLRTRHHRENPRMSVRTLRAYNPVPSTSVFRLIMWLLAWGEGLWHGISSAVSSIFPQLDPLLHFVISRLFLAYLTSMVTKMKTFYNAPSEALGVGTSTYEFGKYTVLPVTTSMVTCTYSYERTDPFPWP